MLFDRQIAPSCAYCRHGSVLSETEVACIKRGIVSPSASCDKFVYDPVKRVPERPSPGRAGTLCADDFTL